MVFCSSDKKLLRLIQTWWSNWIWSPTKLSLAKTSWFYNQGFSAWKFSSLKATQLEKFQIKRLLSLTIFKLKELLSLTIFKSRFPQLENFQVEKTLSLKIFKMINFNYLQFIKLLSLKIFKWEVQKLCLNLRFSGGLQN